MPAEFDDIDVLDHEQERSGSWQEFSYDNLQGESNSKLALMFDEKWIPKSCLRIDGYGELWIACDFYAKNF